MNASNTILLNVVISIMYEAYQVIGDLRLKSHADDTAVTVAHHWHLVICWRLREEVEVEVEGVQKTTSTSSLNLHLNLIE